MPDVGIGQLATVSGRYRTKKLRDGMKDSTPFYQCMDKHGGISRIAGGRSVIQEGMTAQNGSASWVGEAGVVSLVDTKVLDAAEFDWKYQLGAVSWTLAEQYKNSGDGRLIDVIGGKFDVLEGTMMNLFHEGMLSNGTGYGGQQLIGAATLCSTTPTSGSVGGIDRSLANAAWFRNQAFNSASDWSEGAVDAGNVKRFLDKGINATIKTGKTTVNMGLLGQTHFEALTAATQAIQIISNESKEADVGFAKLTYRGVPMYYGNGINYSGFTAHNLTRTYLFNTAPGGINLFFHNKAEFDMLDPFTSQDQAAKSRLMFTMAVMTIGALARTNWVGFD